MCEIFGDNDVTNCFPVQELSEEERKIWNDKAAETMNVYKKELEEYNKNVVASASDIKPEEQ